MKSLLTPKVLLVIGCLLAAAAPVPASPAAAGAGAAPIPCVAPAAGLVGWWTADNHSADIVNGMDATLNGATYTPGRVGAALHFDGVGAYATAPAQPDLTGATEFSIEFWFRPNRDIFPGEARVFPLLTNGPDYTLDISNGDSQLEVRGPVPRPASGSWSWFGGIWYHIAITYSAMSGYTMYLDGTNVSTSPDTLSLLTGAATLGFAWEPGTASVPPTPGDLDEITIYRSAIGWQDVANIYQAGTAGIGKCKYRMPFIGTFPITQGPHCPGLNDHIGPLQNEAIDYAMEHHTVLASQAGIVEHAGANPGSLGLGWYIRIRHHDGNHSVYAHLKGPASILVRENDRVVPLQPLVALDQLRSEAFQASPLAQIVVTSDGLVALTNRRAEALFGVSSRDVGRPFRDLDVSYRPVELRKYIEQAQVERRMMRATEVEYLRGTGDVLHLEVQINPLVDGDSSLLGVVLIFEDVTEVRRLQQELESANRQLEVAYEELQSTNEELETTNEELQSTVEELETTNEELQSTNEELETMNEELQSTNDELQNTNDRLRESTTKLDDANVFLETILTSLRAGVIVVNRELQVQVWNRRAEDLWGLRSDEAVGQHFLNLDIGLPLERLRPIIRQVLAGGEHAQETQLSAVNRRGRNITVRVVCTALTGEHASVAGAIVLMEDEQGG